MDVFSLIRMVTAMLCDELSDAAKNVTPATPAQRARFGALVKVCALMRDAMEQASAADAVTPKKRRAILLGILTPATPAQRARFGALVKVCALMRDAMEQASAADAVTPKKRRAILLGILDGLNDIDADARRTCNTDRWKAYATEKVTRYTRGLLASLNMTKEAVA